MVDASNILFFEEVQHFQKQMINKGEHLGKLKIGT